MIAHWFCAPFIDEFYFNFIGTEGQRRTESLIPEQNKERRKDLLRTVSGNSGDILQSPEFWRWRGWSS